MTTICIFGDSITHGAGDSQGGWAERLKQFLQRKGDIVYVLGIDGDTSTGLLRRFACEATARQPDSIIFAIGINDTVYYPHRGVQTSPSQFQTNLQKLFRLAKHFTAQIIVLGLTPVDETKTTPVPWNGWSYDNQRIQQYDQILQESSQKEKVHYLKLFSLLSVDDLEDGLHPRDSGHQKIGEAVKSQITKYLHTNI
ncbi:hypothetical protein HYT55_05725 [Candidatus Woesearchaeota archaeon]|nr:hypothetical protein [Candidatus Woesearchaeota archaeon]